MSAVQIEQPAGPSPRSPAAPVLRTLVICDLADSTALIERLGDQRAAELMRTHDRVARDLLEQFGGREIDKTDGFLLLFERPVQAISFALGYQRELRRLAANAAEALSARVGIHVGDVVLWDNSAHDVARGAKPVELEGLVKPVAARLMSIARPGQILLSGIAYQLARRAEGELTTTAPLQWRAHGNYRFKGVADPVQIYEVGEDGVAPFKAPAWTGKAHREIPWWRRPGMLLVEAAVVLVAVAVPVYFSLRSPPAIAFAERDWVVVADLRNLTGQSVLDDSLDTAFRVSLEQSKFVNLVSSLQVNDALKRMQKPDGTKVDRAVGSEIAMREGARALILPSVAEIGGRVRVTAEVVDPHTQATVYAETADGIGLDSILPSVGKVSGELRGRLGEAVASIETNNAPLPKATTSNLDALRAYSLGLQALAHGRSTDALGLFQRAVELDTAFALAYMGMARVYANNNDDVHAYEYAHKAAGLKDRLPTRDRLYIDAWLGNFGPPGPMLDKWRLLGKLYPDYYAAAYNVANFSWQYENRFEYAIDAVQPALSEHDPFRGTAFYTLASLQAAQNRFAEAHENFHKAIVIGNGAQGIFYANAYAAQRRFADANALLDKIKPSGIVASDLAVPQVKVTMQLDQGHWDVARSNAADNVKAAVNAGPRDARVARAIELGLDDYLAPPTQISALRVYIADTRKAMDEQAKTNHDDDVFAVLYGAYLAVRAGDYALAQTALTAAAPQAHGSGYPNLEHMLAIVEAELLWREGQPQEAVLRLESTVDGTELYLTHVALADAYTAAARYDDALRTANWLSSYRGRAYFEWNSFQILQTRNIVESNIALLRKAELNLKLGLPGESQKALTAFRNTWPVGKLPDRVEARLSKLQAEPRGGI